MNQEEKYKGEDKLIKGELLKIPNIKLNEKNEFSECGFFDFCCFTQGFPQKQTA